MNQTTPGGLYVPDKKSQAIIYFAGGGRAKVEFKGELELSKDPRTGALVGIKMDSESNFLFLRAEAIQAIEVIK